MEPTTMQKADLQAAFATARSQVRNIIAADMEDVRALAVRLIATIEAIEGTSEEEHDMRELAGLMLRYATKLGGGVTVPRPLPAASPEELERLNAPAPSVPEQAPAATPVPPMPPEPLSVYGTDLQGGGRLMLALRPELWTTLFEAQDALRAHIQQEYAARTQTRAISLEAVLELAFLNQRTEAQEIELAQHRIWAERLRNVDGVLHAKLADVAALTSLEEARAYAASVEDGWQT